ncbi:MAG: hypothetical protein H0V07_02940 [Propionibacteriales bacterium]|nr:hypothetical protein [Propionibacteriales bacterium]
MSVRSQVSGQAKVAGVIVGILGLWGALVPFFGPSFGYGMGGVQSWTWSESHLTLHLAPGLVAVAGGALLVRGRRVRQIVGALAGVVGGAWFVIAPSLHPLWAGQSTNGMSGMSGMGHSAMSEALSALGYHYGTGALIAIVAAYALGAVGARQRAAAEVRMEASQTDRPAATDSSRVGVRG